MRRQNVQPGVQPGFVALNIALILQENFSQFCALALPSGRREPSRNKSLAVDLGKSTPIELQGVSAAAPKLRAVLCYLYLAITIVALSLAAIGEVIHASS
jgi:hypothetical protein